jgi:hypothetical protein
MHADFIAHPYAGIIAAQALDAMRSARARDVTLAAPLPALKRPGTAYPRGPFDLPVIRDCDADGAQPYALEAA